VDKGSRKAEVHRGARTDSRKKNKRDKNVPTYKCGRRSDVYLGTALGCVLMGGTRIPLFLPKREGRGGLLTDIGKML